MAKVYVKYDEQDRLVAIDSDIFLRDAEGYTQIDEGPGDRYALAQSNYLDAPVREDHGVPRYKRGAGERPVPRTDAEIQTDIDALPVAPDAAGFVLGQMEGYENG